MSIRPPDQLASEIGSHGFRPFSYTVEFSKASDPREFAEDDNYSVRLVKLRSIEQGYGTGPFTAQFTCQDKDFIKTTTTGTTASSELDKPAHGDLIQIWIESGDSRILQFKGAIESVHEDRSHNGISYSCAATSLVHWLDDPKVTLNFNLHYDPLHSTPRFDLQGEVMDDILVTSKKLTVREIVDAILDYPDAWGHVGYFSKQNIDWQGLDNHPDCGNFIPNDIVLSGTPKGQAVLQVLQRAGNYSFVYDPAADRIVIVDLNLRYDRLGPQWPIRFASTFSSTGTPYAHEVDVIRDETEWSSRETANVCRVISGPISWYTGHWIIPNRIGTTESPLEDNTVTDRSDTAQSQIQRATNFESCYYRFSTPSNLQEDRRDEGHRKLWVGGALFPDWNVHEDFLPAIYEVQNVELPPSWFDNDNTITTGDPPVPTVGGVLPATKQDFIKKYKGQVEFRSRSRGDMILSGDRHMGQLGHLVRYQMWFVSGTCPACDGTGAVDRVYSGAHNEPQIQWVTLDNGRKVPKVTNYIFDPIRFGSRIPGTTTLYDHGALTPFVPSVAQPYPIPHKNLCPYCRGVGLKPEWKIRHLRQEPLVETRAPKASPDDVPIAEGKEINLDTLPSTAETWREAQNRISLQLDPVVAQEVIASTRRIPLPEDKNKPYSLIPKLADPQGGSIERENVYRFEHPLKYEQLRKALADVSFLNLPSNHPDALIAPAHWDATVPFTAVKIATTKFKIDYSMGQVIFDQPVFIPCTKWFNDFYVVNKDKVLVSQSGLLKTRSLGRGHRTEDAFDKPTGYWRPARVWLQGFYHRFDYYDHLPSSSVRRIVAQSPEGHEELYDIRAAIIDGRYALEVRKVRPDDHDDNIELAIGNRVKPVELIDQSAKIEVYPDDFFKDPTPPRADLTDEEYEHYKTTEANCAFPRGKVLQWLPASPEERKLAGEGLVDSDYFGSMVRPRLYSWRLRDDRSRLLGKAIRTLEAQNNLHVTGSLTVVGMQMQVSNGLGWVDYPDRGRASIRRITYRFDKSMTVTLELSREQARFGELPIADEMRISDMEATVVKLVRRTTNETGGKHA